jgi:hypothetical protein
MYKYIGALFLMGLFSCNNAPGIKKDTAQIKIKKSGAIESVSFVEQKNQEIYNDYLTLKEALVNSKFKEASSASKQLGDKLAVVDGCENTALIAKKISTAANIADQRKDFTFLSSDVIAMFKHADIKVGTVYVQHCPMANRGDGGDWLSSSKAIENPYYGSQMMECGGVIAELKPMK